MCQAIITFDFRIHFLCKWLLDHHKHRSVAVPECRWMLSFQRKALWLLFWQRSSPHWYFKFRAHVLWACSRSMGVEDRQRRSHSARQGVFSKSPGNSKHLGSISYLFTNWFTLKQSGDTISKLCRKKISFHSNSSLFLPRCSTLHIPGHKTQLLWKTGWGGNGKLENNRQIPSFVAVLNPKYKTRFVTYWEERKIKGFSSTIYLTQ